MQENSTYKIAKIRYIQSVAGLALLLTGCSIYLLFRSKHIYLYQWIVSIGFSRWVDSLRERVCFLHLHDFMRFSLPDGLFCASYILLMDALNARTPWKTKLIYVVFIPLVAIVHEFLQLCGLTKGTFDVFDIVCYVTPLLIYIIISRNYIKQ